MNYNPLPGQLPALLHQDFVQALFTLQPVRQLTADETYLLDRDHNAHNGALVYESQILRTKINYQFTRSLSARVIVEYDSTLANRAETTLPRTKQVQTQALLTWLPDPGTAIYVGWNNVYKIFRIPSALRWPVRAAAAIPISPSCPGAPVI